MKLQAHEIPADMSDLEKDMFVATLETIKARRKEWNDAGPRAYEKHQRIARAAARARKLRERWGDEV